MTRAHRLVTEYHRNGHRSTELLLSRLLLSRKWPMPNNAWIVRINCSPQLHHDLMFAAGRGNTPARARLGVSLTWDLSPQPKTLKGVMVAQQMSAGSANTNSWPESQDRGSQDLLTKRLARHRPNQYENMRAADNEMNKTHSGCYNLQGMQPSSSPSI